jgi:hypothetical protein
VTAASGLALARAPDVAHYISFLRPLAENDNLASGLATTLAPAVGATLFIVAALFIVDCECRQYSLLFILNHLQGQLTSAEMYPFLSDSLLLSKPLSSY